MVVVTNIVIASINSLFAKDCPRSIPAIGTVRLLGGIIALSLGAFFVSSPMGYLNYMEESMADYESMVELVFVATLVGGVFMILGTACITVALGTFTRKSWAWTLNMILTPVLLLLTILGIVIVPREIDITTFASLGVNAFILYFLSTRSVRTYFGKIRVPIPPNSDFISSLGSCYQRKRNFGMKRHVNEMLYQS